jgi:hypothetical protein
VFINLLARLYISASVRKSPGAGVSERRFRKTGVYICTGRTVCTRVNGPWLESVGKKIEVVVSSVWIDTCVVFLTGKVWPQSIANIVIWASCCIKQEPVIAVCSFFD